MDSWSVSPPPYPSALRLASPRLLVIVLSHFNFSSGEEPAAIQSSRAGKGGVDGRGRGLRLAVVVIFFHVLVAPLEV